MAKQPKPGKGGVGYCSPPKGSQFKPGQSGNPKGKAKATLGFAELVAREGRKTVTIQTEVGPKKITKAEWLAINIFNRAGKGEANALRLVSAILLNNVDPEQGADKPISDAELHLLKLAFSQMDSEES